MNRIEIMAMNRKKAIGLLVVVAIGPYFPGKAAAEDVHIYLQETDGTPIPGVQVDYLDSASPFNVLYSENTDSTGYSHYFTPIIGLTMCKRIYFSRPGWHLRLPAGSPSNVTPYSNTFCHPGPVFTIPAIRNSSEGMGAYVYGGAHGYVNPSAGEQATIIVTPPVSESVIVRIRSARGNVVWSTERALIGNAQNKVMWDGRDSDGRPVASGIYHVEIKGQSFGSTVTTKVAIIRK